MNKNYGLTKIACYTTNIGMAAIGILSPLLFVTFNSKYSISYTLLGMLVVINFVTQLFVDTMLTFFWNRRCRKNVECAQKKQRKIGYTYEFALRRMKITFFY